MAETSRACFTAIRMAVGNAFDDDEIEKLLTRPLRNKVNDIMAQEGVDQATAIRRGAAEAAKEQIVMAMYEASAKHYTEISRTFRQGNLLARLTGMGAKANPTEASRSYSYGTEGKFHGSAVSTASWGAELGNEILTAFWRAIDARPGLRQRISSDVMMRGEPGFSRTAANYLAMLQGNTSIVVSDEDADAMHYARAAKALLDASHQIQSDRGAIIPKLTGYIGRQSWAPDLVAGTFMSDVAQLLRSGLDPDKAADAAVKKNFVGFRDLMRAKLDPITWRGLGVADMAEGDDAARDLGKSGRPEVGDGAPLDDDEARAQGQRFMQGLFDRGLIDRADDLVGAFLYRVWSRIALGRREPLGGALDQADFAMGGNKARALGKARVLHFLNPDAAIDAAAQYSHDNLHSTLVKTAIRAGRNAALLEYYGPNPEWGYRESIQFLKDQSDKMGLPLRATRLLGEGATRVPFEAVSGVNDAPVNARMAKLFSDLRMFMQTTKLGSIPLSKPADFSYLSQMMIRNGAGFLKDNDYILKGMAALADPERRAAARSFGAGLRNFTGRMTSTWMAQGDDARPGRMSAWAQQAFRASGFLALNESVETMAVAMLQALHGDYADSQFGELPKQMQETFERFQLGEQHWDLARKGLLASPEDGQRYMTFDHLDEDESPLADETRARFRMLYHKAMTDSINEPGIYEQAAARAPFHEFGWTGSLARPGTIQGELMSSFFQFKGFVTGAVRRHLMPAIGEAREGNYAPLVHLMLSATLTGYLGLQLKRLSRGETIQTPQDLVEAAEAGGKEMSAPEAWAKVWAASLAQGGALGMYGDFLFGNMDRNGADFDLTSTGGPMLSQAGQVAKIFLQAINGGEVNGMDGRRLIPGEVFKLASQNVPIVNTWYTRLALDYLLFWRLQEWASPGYLQRYQDRMQEKAATHYWLAPTSAQ